jgi:positive regulator of sigma E activity
VTSVVWSLRPGRRRFVVTGASEEQTAAGIYGVIVSAAVMAASHADTAVAMVVAVLVTLVVYWSAERFARLVAERIHQSGRPDVRRILAHLTAGWEIVTASVLPLLVLIVARLLGRDLDTAVVISLSCSTLLLCAAGWEMGRHGHLTVVERFVVTAVAGLFGIVLIALKALLH